MTCSPALLGNSTCQMPQAQNSLAEKVRHIPGAQVGCQVVYHQAAVVVACGQEGSCLAARRQACAAAAAAAAAAKGAQRSGG